MRIYRVKKGVVKRGGNNTVFEVKNLDEGEFIFTIEKKSFNSEENGFSLNTLSDFVYIGADRRGPQVFLSNTVTESNPLGERGEHCYEFIYTHSEKKIEPPVAKERTQSLRLAINSWLSEIAPGTELTALSHKGLDISSIEVDGYRPTNVGFGVSYSLPIITALLAFANSQGDENKKYIICIENPEAHLHPKAQTQMGELIARCAASGTQVIVETHSDHLLDGIRIAVKNGIIPCETAVINYFNKENGCTEIETLHIKESGDLTEWPSGFFDQFMVNGRELLK